MSVLHEIDAAPVAAAAVSAQQGEGITLPSIPPEVVTAVKAGINSIFWKWYETHRDNTVAHVHFWIFTKELKVSDLQQVFTLLFGAEGEDMTAERPPATVAPQQ